MDSLTSNQYKLMHYMIYLIKRLVSSFLWLHARDLGRHLEFYKMLKVMSLISARYLLQKVSGCRISKEKNFISHNRVQPKNRLWLPDQSVCLSVNSLGATVLHRITPNLASQFVYRRARSDQLLVKVNPRSRSWSTGHSFQDTSTSFSEKLRLHIEQQPLIF